MSLVEQKDRCLKCYRKLVYSLIENNIYESICKCGNKKKIENKLEMTKKWY